MFNELNFQLYFITLLLHIDYTWWFCFYIVDTIFFSLPLKIWLLVWTMIFYLVFHSSSFCLVPFQRLLSNYIVVLTTMHFLHCQYLIFYSHKFSISIFGGIFIVYSSDRDSMLSQLPIILMQTLFFLRNAFRSPANSCDSRAREAKNSQIQYWKRMYVFIIIYSQPMPLYFSNIYLY